MIEYPPKREWDTITCSECRIEFALLYRHKKKLKETHNTFYCPNGHTQRFFAITEAEEKIEKLQKVLERQKKGLESADNAYAKLNMQLDEAKRSSASLKGQITKLKKKGDPSAQ